MTVPVVLAIAGVIAILFGIIGGGIKAKEIEIPSLPAKSRMVTIIIGVTLISISLWLENRNNTPIAPTPTITEVTLPASVPSIETLQVPSATPKTQLILFQEDFSTNNFGWMEGDFSDQYAVMKNEFVNGRLLRTATGKGSFIERTWVPNITLKDFQMSFDAIVVDAPEDAVVCIGLRRSSDNHNFYNIYLGVNGTFGITLVKSRERTTVYEAKLPDEIKIEEGKQNSFNITVQGPTITIVVNGKVLATIDDTGLIEPGNIGLGVGISDKHDVAETVIVEFDNLVIREAP